MLPCSLVMLPREVRMPPASEPCKSEKRFMSAYREEVYVSVYRSASCVCPGGERREMTFLSGANKQTNKKKNDLACDSEALAFPAIFYHGGLGGGACVPGQGEESAGLTIYAERNALKGVCLLPMTKAKD